MMDTIKSLEDLGYIGMIGLLRARFHGIITSDEYYQIKKYAHSVLGISDDWWKVLVWRCPS